MLKTGHSYWLSLLDHSRHLYYITSEHRNLNMSSWCIIGEGGGSIEY